MRIALLVGGLLACLAGCRNDPPAAPPDYPRRTLSELRDSGAEGRFLVTGTVVQAPDGVLLTEDVLLCCTGVTVGFRAEDGPDWPRWTGKRVAVSCRVKRVGEAGMAVRRGAAGFLAIVEGYTIEPERIAAAETLIQRDNIVDKMESEAPSIFLRALRETGVADALRGAESITILAPVDQAFEDTDDTLFDPANKEQLRRLVLRHIVRTRLRENDLMDRSSVTVFTHEEFPVRVVNGSLRIAGARTVFENITGSNGVMHLISAVLQPGNAAR